MYYEQTVAAAKYAGRAADPPIPAPEFPPFRLQLCQATPGLQRHAIHLTRDWHRAQDLVQDTLVKAWANRMRYVPGTNLPAWLNTIMRNTFFSDIRRRWREVEDVDGILVAGLSQQAPQDHVVALAELLIAMQSLPKPQREALVLVGAEGYSILEAAEQLGCASGTVKSRVSRARATLSARLFPGSEADGQTPKLTPTSKAAPHDQDRLRRNRRV